MVLIATATKWLFFWQQLWDEVMGNSREQRFLKRCTNKRNVWIMWIYKLLQSQFERWAAPRYDVKRLIVMRNMIIYDVFNRFCFRCFAHTTLFVITFLHCVLCVLFFLYVIERMWNSIMREMRYKMQVLCMVGA